MVSKYDIFEIVYKNKGPMKPKEVRANFKNVEYNTIHMALVSLQKIGLLVKTKYGFEVKSDKKSTLLYNLISYCLQNNINHNLLLDKNLIQFISHALQQGEITSKNSKLNSKTLQKYVSILSNYGLLLIISQKPLKVKVFYNSLIKNLLIFFDLNVFVKPDKIDYLPFIKKELTAFKSLREKNEAGYQLLVQKLEISFVHHSLSLEGNPITLPDTFKLLQHQITPANISTESLNEVLNYQKAILQMLTDNGRLTLQRILEYHRVSMNHRPNIAGLIRSGKVFIRGNPAFILAEPDEIELKLQALLEKYNLFFDKKKKSVNEIIEFAAYFHNEFQHIHPFEDGNSRTTRLLTFYILRSESILVLDLPFGLLDEYMNNTKNSLKRDDKQLSHNLQKVVFYNLITVNRKLRS
ncbi:Fic family protein [Candidatus Woesearchaeota archaeon]|nr:Fic family protein [Candidatus Woesearchaeota archaeon]